MNSQLDRSTYGYIQRNQVPVGKRLLRCKWVFDYKLDIGNGCLLKFKARLVAMGHQQEYGVDY